MAERGPLLLTWVLLWAGLAVMLILMRRKASLWVQQDRSLAMTVAMLDRPMTAAAVIILVVSSIVDVQAPTAWFDLINLLLLLTIVLLLFGFSKKPSPDSLPDDSALPAAAAGPALAGWVDRPSSLAARSGVGRHRLHLWFLRTLKSDPGQLPEAWMRR